MRKIVALFILCLTMMSTTGYSQDEGTYVVNGEEYFLKSAVKGTINLLWNTIDGEFKYFVQKGGDIYELKNTKGADGKYQEEFKEVLRILTGDSSLLPDETDLTLSSLKYYINSYNKSKDDNYEYNSESVRLKTRLGLWGGISNNPFVTNPDNTIVPIFGAEFEIYEDETAKRHAGFIEFKQSLKGSDFDYQSSQVSFNYRFRFVFQRNFNIYAQVKFASYTYSSNTSTFIDETTMQPVTVETSGGGFETPFVFGLGADFRIANEQFISLVFGEATGIFVDHKGNFPIDARIGYKFKL